MRGYSKGKGVIFVQVIVLTVLVLIIFPQWVHGHYWVSLSGYGTPSIDGVMNADEWENAGYAGIDINLPDGTTTPGNLYVMNDDVNLYFAFQFDYNIKPSPDFAAINVYFDNDHDGIYPELGHDYLVMNWRSTASLGDGTFGFVNQGPPCVPGYLCGNMDWVFGGTTDGDAEALNDGGSAVVEISHPLNSANNAHDINLSMGDTVGFQWYLIFREGGAGTTTISRFGDIIIANSFIEALIDIKPGSYPNSINLGSAGVIPVAILTTEDFDATTVDPLTVVFGPGGAMEFHEKGHIEDVDEDGDLDLVLHFKNQDTGIECANTEAFLAGETYDGQDFMGSDSISTLGCE